MRHILIPVLSAALLVGCLTACDKLNFNSVKDPIKVSSPEPAEQITKVNITKEEAALVDSGNSLTFNLFPLLQKGEGSVVFSPLSLQYALGMTANGASGETLQEIVKALGFDTSIEALNALCNKLLNELPALDLGVKLKLADAILVNDLYPLQPSFKEQVESTYYAAVENMSFEDPEKVASRINDWASRNTNGLIDKMLDSNDISAAAIAFLMNALYFKAPWVEEGRSPLFHERGTSTQNFYQGGCKVLEVPTMHTSSWFNYADLGNFSVLEIPYASGKFAMYIILPEGEQVGDQTENVTLKYNFSSLMKDFPSLDWKEIRSGMKHRKVNLSLPRFETSSSYRLNDALKKLGMELAFTSAAQFDRMFDNPTVNPYIDYVIQKARISVTEWGTEAAAVTVVAVGEGAAMETEPPVDFVCDHPFAYLIAEKSTGAILFAGAFCGQ